MCGRQKKVSDGTTTEKVRMKSDPVVTTKEVANELPISHDRTRQRLNKLHEDDSEDVAKKELDKTPSTHVWWTPNVFEPKINVQKTDGRDINVEDGIRQLELPGTDVVLKVRRVAVQMAYNYIGENGERSLEALTDYLMEYNPAGYSYQRTALRDMVLESIKSLDQVQVESNEECIIIKR